MALPRVIANYCIVDKRTPSLRGEILGADTTGPAVARVGTVRIIRACCWLLLSAITAHCSGSTRLGMWRKSVSVLTCSICDTATVQQQWQYLALTNAVDFVILGWLGLMWLVRQSSSIFFVLSSKS